jgi:hypothetical protein
VSAGCKGDPRCGDEFRCIAAKAPDYISFCDNGAARRAAAAAAYLKRGFEKRGNDAKWRISNILNDRRILSWTASRCRVRISGNSSPWSSLQNCWKSDEKKAHREQSGRIELS